MKHKVMMMGIAASLLVVLCVGLNADTLTIQCDKMADVRKADGNTNFGDANPCTSEGWWSSTNTMRIFFGFDFAAVAPYMDINDVTITFYKYSADYDPTISLAPALSDWQESEITYINRPGVGSNVASAGVGTGGGGTPISVNSPELTSLVKDWIDGTADNHGFMLNHGGTSGRVRFYSDDEQTETLRPHITMTYSLLPGAFLIQTAGTTEVTEAGNTDTYQVALTTQPTEQVTVMIETDGQTLVSTGTAAPATQTSLDFYPGDYDQPQTITVTAVDDSDIEITWPPVPHISNITHTAYSSDPSYMNGALGKDVGTVDVYVTDNDWNCGHEGMQMYSADANGDCYVNIADFAMLAGQWMRCNVPNQVGCDITW